MADDPFAESPWEDQVSLTHHNSSTSSVDKTAGQPASAQVSGGDASDATHSPVVAPPSLLHAEGDEELLGKQATPSTPEKTSSTGFSTTSTGGARRTPARQPRSRKVITQPVFEQDSSSDPLGPLGSSGLAGASAPTSVEDTTADTDRDASTVTDKFSDLNVGAAADSQPPSASLFHDVPLVVDQTAPAPKLPASVKPAGPYFDISVGDPVKVGDITSAHTVYTVHTKTNSPNFSKSEMTVTRRYRDFRWLLHALEHSNQGIIVPPPPDKQAVGRFNEDFVEHRRSALENMLRKISVHPQLYNDPDFKLFLESEAFASDIKNRVMSPEEIEAATSASSSSGSGGFMGTLGGAFSFSTKFVETSQWFIDKKAYLDSLESQLKSLSKALDLVVTQRRELSDTTSELSLVLESLADVEVSRSLSTLLTSFSEAQTRIKDLYVRQCMQDILSLSTTLDEYIRLISSVRAVFAQRQKSYFAVQTAEQELSKKRNHLDKLMRQGKTLQDKIAALQQDVDAQEKKVLNLRVAFDDISKRITGEFDRLENEKIHDFRNAVELFLENAVEAQKEAIEVWETFYQRSFVSAQS